MRKALLAFLAAACLSAGRPLDVSAQVTPKKVLLIGDSHTATPFGIGLDEKLRGRFGATVATYGVGATNLSWWVSRQRYPIANGRYFFRAFNEAPVGQKTGYAPPPDIDAMMGQDWDIVVIALGSNPDQPSLDNSVSAGMLLLTKLPKKSQCFWVGPPPMPVYGTHTDDFYGIFPQILRLGGHACRAIDSRQIVSAAESVGSHYYGAAAAKWATAVFQIIAP
jgi:hypothetical protein